MMRTSVPSSAGSPLAFRSSTLVLHRIVALLGLAVALVCSLPASTARADVRTEARTFFRRGMALIADGNVDAGVAELERAYEILPHPNVIYNIARAYAESGRYQESVEHFERYLESDPPDREEVLGFLRALRERLSRAEQDRPRDTESPAPDATTEGGAASDEDIQTLEDSATQIAALAEATQSDALRARAERLREMAEARRRGSEGSLTPVTPESPESPESDVESEDPQALTINDEHQGDVYEESVFTASRSAESPLDAPNSTTIVTAQDVRLSGLQTPSLVLRRVAGVSILASSPGDQQLSIRGLNGRLSNRTIVLVDGRSVYLDFLGTTLYNFLPLSMEDIERIEVIRGPASALYGADAMSGIVNIITRPLGEGRSYVTASMGDGGQYLLRAGAYARADRFRFRVGGGYQRQDMFALEVVPGRVDIEASGRDPNLGYERLYFHGELSYRFDGGYLLRAGTGIVEGEVTFQGLSRLRQLRGRDGLFAQTFASFETPWGLSARVFWNRLDLTGDNVGLVPGGLELSQRSVVSSDIVDTEIVFSQDFDLLGVDNRLIAGVSYRYKEVRWDWLANGSQMQHHGAVFLQDTMRFSDVAQLVLSVRGDLHPLAGPQVSPRGSLLFHPTAGQTIRLTGGAAFRSPSFVESYAEVPNETPLRGVTTFGVGNPALNPERLFSVELGYMNQMTEYFSLELNGYYNFVIDPILLTQNRAFRLWDFRNDTGLARYHPEFQAYPLGQLEFANEAEQFQQIGGELGVRIFPVQGLDVYANYAIHETSHVGGPRGALTDDARTSAHMVNGGVQYRAPFGLDLSIDVSWQSSQVWYEQVVDTERGGVSFQRFGLPSYTTLNARIGYRLFDDQLELAIIGTNLVDAGHREHPFGQPIDRRFLGTATVRF